MNSGASIQSNSYASGGSTTYGGGGGVSPSPPMSSHYDTHYGTNVPMAGATGHANLDLHYNTYFDTLASYNTQAYQPEQYYNSGTMREGFDSERAAEEVLYLRQAFGA